VHQASAHGLDRAQLVAGGLALVAGLAVLALVRTRPAAAPAVPAGIRIEAKAT